MVTIKFKVTGQNLKLIEHKRFVATSDTINYFRCRVRFAEDWDIYTDRSIYFKNMSSDICKPGVFNDDGYCFVPWEVLANTGVIIASAVGVVMDGEEIAERLTTFPVELFVQVEEGQISVQPNEDPTPSQYEQFIANVQEYSEAAIQAKIRANNFAINAEASAGQASASAAIADNRAAIAETKAGEASASATAAGQAASSAGDSSKLSRSWAVGDTNSRSGEASNNSRYYSEQSSASASAAAASAESANTSMGAASAAQNSAVNANNSAQEAAQNAMSADTHAAASKLAAEASANNAASSASSAGSSASNASASEVASSNSAAAANTSALSSAESSSLASAKALLSQSWAEGGTGSRTDEDVNNAKYWSERSAAGQIQANWAETDSASKAFICNKPTVFPPEAHTHDDRYYTETEINTFLSGKSSTEHTHTKSNITDFAHVHDDRYYTESETDALLLGKSDVTHLHDDRYYTESEINTALSAKADLENGKVPAAQLPAYVDDVLEYATVSSFPATGESGKIYIAQDTNLTYRWTGSGYAEISQSLALGETSSTAFRGDHGKSAYDHISDSIVHITAAERTSWNGKLDSNGAKESVGLTSNLDYTITDTEYQELVNLLGGGRNRLIDWLMPVGHIIESTNANFDPNALYVGTTWVKIEGRFLFGSGGSYSLGDTGGEKTHTLTVGEMPSHSHIYAAYATNVGGGGNTVNSCNGSGNVLTETRLNGGSSSHNNMPPYIVVNIWKRTA